MFLSLNYQLTIVSGVSEEKFARKYEPWCHAVAILWPFIFSTTALFFDVYNPLSLLPGCYMRSYPPGCEDMEGVECIRGQQAASLVLPYQITLLIIWIAIIVSNLRIYCHVRRMIKRTQQFAMTDVGLRKTRQVAIQCFLYV